MNGLFLNGTSRGIPPGVSSFAVFFKPILSTLAKYYWDYVSIAIPDTAPEEISDAYLALYHQVNDLPYIPPDTYLPRFADYVYDGSWHTFCGYLTIPAPDEEIDISFQCVDGGPCWTIHSCDEGLLRIISDHARQLPGVTIQEAAPW